MRIVLDTNRYRDFCDGDLALTALLEEAESIHLPFIVLAELLAGFAIGKKGPENERILQRFLSTRGVDLLWPNQATARIYANLYQQLRQAGTPIPTNDLWIAALVVEHDFVLCSRDRHFHALPQLNIVSPEQGLSF